MSLEIIKTNKIYTNEEIFETLKRENDFKGIYTHKALFEGVSTRIPSHTADVVAEDTRAEDCFFDIKVLYRKGKIEISESERVPFIMGRINDDDYHKGENPGLFVKIVSECKRLFP